MHTNLNHSVDCSYRQTFTLLVYKNKASYGAVHGFDRQTHRAVCALTGGIVSVKALSYTYMHVYITQYLYSQVDEPVSEEIETIPPPRESAPLPPKSSTLKQSSTESDVYYTCPTRQVLARQKGTTCLPSSGKYQGLTAHTAELIPEYNVPEVRNVRCDDDRSKADPQYVNVRM